MPQTSHSFTEEISITADKLVETVKDLIHEGNVRHVIVKNAEGHTIFELPVSVSLIGVILAPALAALGAIAVFAANFTVIVTRDQPPAPPIVS